MKSKLLKKQMFAILSFELLLIIAFGLIAYMVAEKITMEHYQAVGQSAAKFFSLLIDGDSVDRYLKTGQTDDYYDSILKLMDSVRDDFHMTYCSVVAPEDEGIRYVWVVENLTRHSSGQEPVAANAPGDLRPYDNGEKEWAQRIMSGEPNVGQIILENRSDAFFSVAAPVYCSRGEAVALIYMEFSYRSILHRIGMLVLLARLAFIVLTSLGGAVYYRYAHRNFTAPILTLNREANDIRARMEAREPYRSDIHTGDEIEELSKSFETMSRDMLDYIDENARITAERQRLDTELDMAASIQANQLPRVFPPFPDRREFDIFASMKPAREVGGDFYDFFMVDDDHIALVIADVSDKGIPACLFMMMSKVLLKNQLQAGKSPAEALADVNAQLMESNKNNQFVTVWTAVLELSTGRGIEANAGHEHPALRRAYGSYELVEYKHSLPLAVMRGTRFKNYEFRLYPGESLFVYTDGVTEASNRENQIFKTDRMLDALNRAPGANPEAAIANVYEGIAAFVGDADQFDDITMLCFHYNGPQEIEQEAE